MLRLGIRDKGGIVDLPSPRLVVALRKDLLLALAAAKQAPWLDALSEAERTQSKPTLPTRPELVRMAIPMWLGSSVDALILDALKDPRPPSKAAVGLVVDLLRLRWPSVSRDYVRTKADKELNREIEREEQRIRNEGLCKECAQRERAGLAPPRSLRLQQAIGAVEVQEKIREGRTRMALEVVKMAKGEIVDFLSRSATEPQTKIPYVPLVQTQALTSAQEEILSKDAIGQALRSQINQAADNLAKTVALRYGVPYEPRQTMQAFRDLRIRRKAQEARRKAAAALLGERVKVRLLSRAKHRGKELEAGSVLDVPALEFLQVRATYAKTYDTRNGPPYEPIDNPKAADCARIMDAIGAHERKGSRGIPLRAILAMFDGGQTTKYAHYEPAMKTLHDAGVVLKKARLLCLA